MGTSGADSEAGPELDALVLRLVMDWKWMPLKWVDGSKRRVLWDPGRGRPSGVDFHEVADGRLLPRDAPSPSTDAGAAREVEGRIAWRRLDYPYTVALVAVLREDCGRSEVWPEASAAERATPLQRCRAALRTAELAEVEQLPAAPAKRATRRRRDRLKPESRPEDSGCRERGEEGTRREELSSLEVG